MDYQCKNTEGKTGERLKTCNKIV